jgi:hypothetical protein
MRLLNSVCKLLASKYAGIPVYIEDVPEGFQRPSFLVTLATEGSNLKNINVYEDTPLYQIVFFSRQNAARQVYSEDLYKKKEELKALFLLPGCIPVIPLEGVKEKKRYAKVTSYSAEVRLSEKSVYVKVGLSFTEDARTEEKYELMQDIDLSMNISKNY